MTKKHYNRRSFLNLSLMAVGSSGIPSNLPWIKNTTYITQASKEKNWISTIRDQIPATKESIYFQTAGIAPSTIGVVEKIKQIVAYQNRGPADPKFSKELAKIEPNLRQSTEGQHLGFAGPLFVPDCLLPPCLAQG